MSGDTATAPTLVQRIDGLIADIRSDKARRRELQNPHRAHLMLDLVMRGGAKELEEMRKVNAALARELVALRAANDVRISDERP